MIYPEAIRIQNTVENIRSLWAIFEHRDVNDVVQFVGYSTLPDVFMFTTACNNSEWGNVFKSDSIVRVLITGYADNEPEAQRLVRNLISVHQPHCNVRGYNMSDRYKNVRCNETGEIFENAATAAKAHGLAPSALSNHLRRITGHKSVRGRTYEYTTDKINRL